MGKLRVMTHDGDTITEWETAEDAAVKEAERIFEERKAQGFTAFRADKDTAPTVLERFDPEANQIVMIPQVAGG